MKKYAACLAVAVLFSCRSLVTTYKEVESAVYYKDASPEFTDFNDTLKVMTWNIRFGAGRIPWFEDSCGDRVLMTESETIGHLEVVAAFIDSVKPDILLLQEVDVSSKRSAYLDQMQWLLENTFLNYGVFASMWEAELIPSGGLGRVNVGNAILSRWKITNAERIKLSLFTDQWVVEKYFYLRRNILKAKINIDELDTTLYAVNIHATAFATDDTKKKHIEKYKEVLDDLNSQNSQDVFFVTGGDLNSVHPGANFTDFCMDDMCNDESFHTDPNDPNGGPHREGSYFNNFVGEPDLVQPFYDSYFEAINLENVVASDHFTHSPWNTISDTTEYWDRKLDYLFTNYQDWSITGETHNKIEKISDHAPVSATLKFP